MMDSSSSEESSSSSSSSMKMCCTTSTTTTTTTNDPAKKKKQRRRRSCNNIKKKKKKEKKKVVHWNPRIKVHPIPMMYTYYYNCYNNNNSMNNMSKEDWISSIWYTQNDYIEIRRQNSNTLKKLLMPMTPMPMKMKMKNGGMIIGQQQQQVQVKEPVEVHSLRGLEDGTKYGIQRRKELIIKTWFVVLGTQERLRNYCNNCRQKGGEGEEVIITYEEASKVLKSLYKQVSCESQSLAYIRGIQDEQDVKEYLFTKQR